MVCLLFIGAIRWTNTDERYDIFQPDFSQISSTSRATTGAKLRWKESNVALAKKVTETRDIDRFTKTVSDKKIEILEHMVLNNGKWVLKKNGLWYRNRTLGSGSLKEIGANKDNFIEIGNLLEISPRLIASLCFAEHMRQRDSYRASMRRMVDRIGATQFLSKTKLHSFSQWLCSIKPVTAREVEKYLKDKKSPYYLWEKYEHVLDYKEKWYETNKLVKERLIDDKWNILYAGIIVKMFEQQREKAGFSIAQRPDILTTLYNLGFRLSKPKQNPQAWWADIVLQYTKNGVVKREQYYYGELAEAFFFSKIFPEIEIKYEKNIINTKL